MEGVLGHEVVDHVTCKRRFEVEYLVRDTEPGGDDTLSMTLRAPPQKGTYVVEFDMVREGSAWFAASGLSSSVKQQLNVESS